MISAESHPQSNLAGDALGPSEPTTNTNEQIIIGENSIPVTLDATYLDSTEMEQLRELQRKIHVRRGAESQLDIRQADSLVEAVALAGSPHKQRDLAEHFVQTIARQHGATSSEVLDAHVDRVLGHAHQLAEGALASTVRNALEFKDARIEEYVVLVKKLRAEVAEARIDTALVAIATEHAFDAQLADYMGDAEEMERIEGLREQVRQSMEPGLRKLFETAPPTEYPINPQNERVTTAQLEEMAKHVTADDKSPARGALSASETESLLQAALALARPSSEY